eukprot:3073667-Pyramimonas_sp.AAC.1
MSSITTKARIVRTMQHVEIIDLPYSSSSLLLSSMRQHLPGILGMQIDVKLYQLACARASPPSPSAWGNFCANALCQGRTCREGLDWQSALRRCFSWPSLFTSPQLQVAILASSSCDARVNLVAACYSCQAVDCS